MVSFPLAFRCEYLAQFRINWLLGLRRRSPYRECKPLISDPSSLGWGEREMEKLQATGPGLVWAFIPSQTPLLWLLCAACDWVRRRLEELGIAIKE
jgi:hypothetical protein